MKRYARVLDSVVTEVIEIVDEIDIADLTPPGYDWVPAAPQVMDGWRYENGKFLPPLVKPVDISIAMAAKWPAAQSFMDSQAVAIGYENLLTAVSYADESAVPRFQADGQKLRVWRSLVREKFVHITDLVVSKAREMPANEVLLNELPAFE